MWCQVDGLRLTGARVLRGWRQGLLAHVEEVDGEISDKDDDARDAVGEERAFRPCTMLQQILTNNLLLRTTVLM